MSIDMRMKIVGERFQKEQRVEGYHADSMVRAKTHRGLTQNDWCDAKLGLEKVGGDLKLGPLSLGRAQLRQEPRAAEQSRTSTTASN